MKTLNFISGSYRSLGKPVIVDFNKNDITQLDNVPSDVDYVFVAPEDIEIRYKIGTKTHVLNANKGDIIVTFYEENYIKNRVVVIKNKEWKENIVSIIAENAARQAKKEKAASMYCDCECPNCSCF